MYELYEGTGKSTIGNVVFATDYGNENQYRLRQISIKNDKNINIP